jgi:hypothetical protein
LNYLLDSNTYIQAKNGYYGMDICPGYWDWLDQQFDLGVVGSINMIAIELKAGNDNLANWVTDRPAHFISNDDPVTQTHFAEIVQIVATGNYKEGSRDNFLQKADPWIIAKAKAINATVVTHESRLTPQTTKVKVPNICDLFNVPCINTFELLGILNARFVI